MLPIQFLVLYYVFIYLLLHVRRTHKPGKVQFIGGPKGFTLCCRNVDTSSVYILVDTSFNVPAFLPTTAHI
jgi:hypothetical protein